MRDRKDSHANWHFENGDLIFSGRLNQHDLVSVDFDALDRKVVCEPIESAADLFQTLEIAFRRRQQQLERRENKP